LRILFDQGTPAPLRNALRGHIVDLVKDLGWQTLRNGELLDLAEEEGYDILPTTDQGIQFQQNLQGRRLAIIVVAPDWPRVSRQVDTIKSAIEKVQPGAYLEVLERDQPVMTNQGHKAEPPTPQ